MKQITVISLLQPWASLVVMGAKKIETRSWNTPYRGELYIHASLGKKFNGFSCREICYTEHFKQTIGGGLGYDKLPFGAIIGKVDMINTIEMTEIPQSVNSSIHSDGIWWTLSPHEKAFGDFSWGRYAWLLHNPVRFDDVIQAKGKQGFWNYKIEE
jgi:hypothetical protein